MLMMTARRQSIDNKILPPEHTIFLNKCHIKMEIQSPPQGTIQEEIIPEIVVLGGCSL